MTQQECESKKSGKAGIFGSWLGRLLFVAICMTMIHEFYIVFTRYGWGPW